MEHKKMNFLNKSSDSNLVTKNWNIANDQLNANYSVGNEIIYSTEVLKFNHNYAYIIVRGNIAISVNIAALVAFKNCAPFIKCITKTDGATIDDTEDLDLGMPMSNMLEYSSKYSDNCFIPKMKQLMLMLILRILIISNLSSIRLN